MTAEASTGAFEFIAVGETMVQFTARAGDGFDTSASATIGIGGAESNVASYLAQFGHSSAWISRVGADPFGARILTELDQLGVDTSRVVIDAAAPTGVYFKSPRSTGGTDVRYYRRGSAASLMSADLLSDLPSARVLHLSGITPALSASCAKLVDEALEHRSVGGPLISFDVNYRPALWPVAEASDRLLQLARASDLVFVGLDEAHTLWDTDTDDDVRSLIGATGILVVKDGEHGATSYAADGARTYCPTSAVDVVEAVGAGDAFAAGYLHGLLTGLDEMARLQAGHHVATSALGTYGDVARL